jgi:hypothetical protein
MKKWAGRLLGVGLGLLLLWGWLQVVVVIATELTVSNGARAGELFVLLAVAILVWVVWWMEAGWRRTVK